MNNESTGLSIIVPTYNEEANIKLLVERIHAALSDAKINYEIIFVDDHSTDQTQNVISNLAIFFPIISTTKVGKKGKAYSILEGAKFAQFDNLAMIDADLQYPPEALPKMVNMLKYSDLVISNRKTYKDTKLRKVLSRTFKFMFGKVLFGLNYDIQSGLKVFTREVFETLKYMPSSSWTFDLEFLHRAKQAGFHMSSYDITFTKRAKGNSKMGIMKQVIEIGSNAIRVKAKRIRPVHIAPKSLDSMKGAGIGYKKRKYITHTTIPHHLSALTTVTKLQKFIVIMIVGILIVGILTTPMLTLKLLIGVLSFIYLADVLFNLFLISKSLNSPQEIISSKDEIDSVKNSDLPIYSILCPLYKEAQIIPQFLEAIEKISWPKDKLDVILLLEEDDRVTIDVAARMDLPSFVRTIIVPHSIPKTKPKACNYGLAFAKGEYVVVYDAEDIPDVDQLKKAFLGFKKSSENVICLQARLNYYNPHQNLLTRFFTAEYSLWFDVTLPGMVAIETALPLGGTSNHFKTKYLQSVHGWDPFNVTEDADLGIRLFNQGYKTAMIDSTTLEEANSNLKNWFRQRSRWIKGYMQTYLVHTRRNGVSSNKKSKHSLYFQLIIGGKIAFVLINPILWIATFAYFALYSYVGPSIEQLYPNVIFYMAIFSLVVGNFLFLYYYMIGLAKKGQWSLIKYVLLVPIYWLMISISAFIALYQLIFKPHYWEKTVHGLHLKKDEVKEKVNVVEEIPAYDDISKKRLRYINIKQIAAVTIYSLGILFIFQDNILYASLVLLSSFLIYVIYTLLFPLLADLLRSVFSNLSDLLSMFKKSNEESSGIRILVLNWRDSKHKWAGGAEVYAHELAKRWVKDGNSVTMFSGNDGKNKSNETIDGVNIIRHGGFYTVYFWAFAYYVIKFRGKFDVIIDTENGIPFFSPLYSRKKKFLLIHHVHQEVFRKSLRWPFSDLALFLEAKLMPFVYRNVQVITVSPSSKKEILKHKLTKKDPIVIYNGVNHDIFKPAKKSQKPMVIYLGRLQYYKSLHIFIVAAKRILKKNPKVQFVIAGEGEEKKKLMNFAKKLEISDQVNFLGKVTEEEKVKIFQEAWVFVNPSYMEGWGITTIEANACGVPAVASNVAGLKDAIKNNETGFLVDYKDYDSFTKSILALIDDESLRKRMSENALNWSKKFSWDISAELFLEVIKISLQEDDYKSESYTNIFLMQKN